MKSVFFNIYAVLSIFITTSVQGQIKVVSWKVLSALSLTNTLGSKQQVTPGDLTVFVMLSPECPLSKNYVPVINVMRQKYNQIQFYGIFPGASYSTKEIADFQKEYKTDFKLLIDQRKRLTSYLKASTTPECILIDKFGLVAYRGLIDNWAAGLGQKRKVITEKFLENAIDDLLNNRSVAISQTKPIGCLINDI